MRKYSETHEWADVADGVATIGISSHAQRELGEVVYLKLPEVGKIVRAGEEAAVLESTKAAADIYSPLSGEVAAVNSALLASTDSVNLSPEGEGWLFKLKISKPAELDELLEEERYRQLNAVC